MGKVACLVRLLRLLEPATWAGGLAWEGHREKGGKGESKEMGMAFLAQFLQESA